MFNFFDHYKYEFSKKEKNIMKFFIFFSLATFTIVILYSLAKNFLPYENAFAGGKKTSDVKIHFLDTGNSDCILITSPDKTVLIDGADNDDEEMIVKYLKDENIKTIDYLISTHYHKDHLGSLDRVILDFDIKNVFVSNATSDIPTYKDFKNALRVKKLKAKIPTEGEKIYISENAYMQIYNTSGGEYINDESLITLLTHGNDKILFTADAEEKAEKRVLDKLEPVDILKVGHHGSFSSTTDALLDVINPKFAVITNSETNPYGNPDKVVMERLKERNIEIHRTDECGHIVFTSTGDGVNTNCPKGSYNFRTVEKIKKGA